MPQQAITTQMDPSTAVTEPQRQALALAALREIMMPAARLMVANGVQLSAMVEVLKQVLVIEATHASVDEHPSDTKVSVLTGVHRKDVKRLNEQRDQGIHHETDLLASVGSQVVGRWISDERFLDDKGSPLPLARTPRYAADSKPSFSELVGLVSKDLGARAILDGLMRLDVVRALDDTTVELRLRGFVPSKAMRESLHFLATNVGDHLASAVHNQMPDSVDAPMLEQSAFSAGLTKQQADRLHKSARVWWERVLKQFLLEATVAESIHPKAGEPTYRVRFGVYFHQMAQDTKQSAKRVSAQLTETPIAAKLKRRKVLKDQE